MIDPLFHPLQIGSVTVKNRICMPAMHLNMCRNFHVSDRLVAFYRRRAKGGAGLISAGYATVDHLSGNGGNIGAHDDSHTPGLSRLAEAIRSSGAKAALQLNHAGRYNHSTLLGGQLPIAPSAVPSKLTRETPRAMEEEDIAAVQQSFAEAAQRVKDAGFDMVEILAGTGYLISEFLSPLTNKRQDQYGGSLENRMRFGLEIIRSVRSQIGDFPLLVRINGNDFMPGGCGREELRRFAVELAAAGVDALSVNVGWHEAQVPQIVAKVPRGVFAYMARAIRESVSVPVIAAHRINDPGIGRRLLAEGYCDMVAMGRALIADPDLPEKARRGAEDSILHCVACGQGCFDNLIAMKKVECLCNPLAGHEEEENIAKTDRPRRVMVVGGGPGGINAALAAAGRGHAVTLYDREMQLGGQLHLAGAAPGRQEFVVLAEDLSRRLSRSTVKVVLNCEVDVELLRTERPESVIIAAGGAPVVPPIEGVDGGNVVQAWDVLRKKRQVGRRVAIIGGGAVGIETALAVAERGTLSAEELKFLLINDAESPEALKQLALNGGRSITVIELQDQLGANFGRSTRWSMLQDLQRYGIAARMNARVLRITLEGVVLETEAGEELLPADSVVLAVGTGPNASLQKFARILGIPCQVVGDAANPATVLEATRQGFRAGLSIT